MFATEALERRHELLVDFIEAGLIASAAQGIVVVGEDEVGAALWAFAWVWFGRAGPLRLGHLRQSVSRVPGPAGRSGRPALRRTDTPPRRSMWPACLISALASRLTVWRRDLAGARPGQSASALVDRLPRPCDATPASGAGGSTSAGRSAAPGRSAGRGAAPVPGGWRVRDDARMGVRCRSHRGLAVGRSRARAPSLPRFSAGSLLFARRACRCSGPAPVGVVAAGAVALRRGLGRGAKAAFMAAALAAARACR